MIKVEMTAEELLKIIEDYKSPIKQRLDYVLKQQVDFFSGNENVLNTYKRDWSFTLMNIVDKHEINKPIQNAYAIYTKEADKIILTDELYKNFFLSMTCCEFQLEHALWMTFLAFVFCVSHEMSHLYAGHSQLCKKNKLGMLYNKKTGLSYFEHQALEIEADHIAAGRAAESIANVFLNGDYERIFRYKSKELFYSDSIKAICRFFYYVRYIAKEEKMYQAKIGNMTHPPAFFRCFWSVQGIIEHYNLYFEDNTKYFLKGFFEDLTNKEISGEPFLDDNKEKKLDFNMLVDYKKMLHNVYCMKIENRINKFRRIPFVHEYMNIHNLTHEEYKKNMANFICFSHYFV